MEVRWLHSKIRFTLYTDIQYQVGSSERMWMVIIAEGLLLNEADDFNVLKKRRCDV